MPYHKFAELIGLQGHLRRRSRARWRPAWDEALAADRPVVLEVKTDPERAAAAAAHHLGAGARRSPRRWSRATRTKAACIVDTAKQVLSSVLPGQRQVT